MKPPFPGRLIVFEGTDGTGKTTQRDRLATQLLKRGLAVDTTKEPTDGPHGRRIRELYRDRHLYSPDEELELFLADRRQHVSERLLPGLAAGKIILCDRYYFSTAAYQGARGLAPQAIFDLHDFAPTPDLVLYFRAPLDLCLQRITQGRGEIPNSFEQADLLARVAAIYETFNFPFWRIIDAGPSVEMVEQAVRTAVEELLPLAVEKLGDRP